MDNALASWAVNDAREIGDVTGTIGKSGNAEHANKWHDPLKGLLPTFVGETTHHTDKKIAEPLVHYFPNEMGGVPKANASN